MYRDVVKVMYSLCLWEQEGDYFAEGVWWSYVQPKLDESEEMPRREMAVAYIIALFNIYQDFICLTLPEYVGRNDDWDEILVSIDYMPDERALLYLSGKYGLPFKAPGESLLPVLLSLANELRKSIGEYLGKLYKNPERAFDELMMSFPLWTKQDIEMGLMPYDLAGFNTFCRHSLTFPVAE